MGNPGYMQEERIVMGSVCRDKGIDLDVERPCYSRTTMPRFKRKKINPIFIIWANTQKEFP